jgi:hypothetical protein
MPTEFYLSTQPNLPEYIDQTQPKVIICQVASLAVYKIVPGPFFGILLLLEFWFVRILVCRDFVPVGIITCWDFVPVGILVLGF